jgi:hypothetical protein
VQTAIAQNCTANAGGNKTVCGSTTSLTGAVSGTTSGSATWSFISGPVTPTIATPTALTTNITGMTADGDYVFQLSQPCGSGTAVSTVTVTAHPRPASFTAGADITGICASVGTTTLNGVIPAGFTGVWSAYNTFQRARNAVIANTNSTFSSTSVATPTFSLTNKSLHTEDPAYKAILTITSLDGLCSYSDTANVIFCPMPPTVRNSSSCYNSSTSAFFDLGFPSLASSLTNAYGGSGNIAYGTTITFNVVSQPAGANIAFSSAEVNTGSGTRIYTTGATIPGTYTFSITTTNCCGSTTSSVMTLTHNGYSTSNVNFQPAGHTAPEQMTLWGSGGTGGEVHCGIAGTSTPELFYFDINAADAPSTVATVASTGTLPTGASTPILTVTGAGTMNRTVSVDPGASGWKVGTYEIRVNIGSSCITTNIYYIHISDNSRIPIDVRDTAFCYAGTGAVSATINLPAVSRGGKCELFPKVFWIL